VDNKSNRGQVLFGALGWLELKKMRETRPDPNCSIRGGEHSGLGLAIVRRILELHGSDIHVRCTPGQGTSFSFSLKIPAKA